MRRVLIAIAVVLLVATGAGEAFGQCSISMLDVNGTPMLCANTGDAWEWSGPGGFTSTDMCVTARTSGTYTLRVYDTASGTWSEPCSEVVGTAPRGPSCSISGADSVCAGSSVQWCGPTGDFTYAWSGPGGFTSSAACVDVSAAGTYSLTLTDRVSGAAGEPCIMSLRVLDCAVPQTSGVCPQPARWWSFACSDRSSPLDAEAFARVAAGVDERSAVWEYGGTTQGLCALLAHRLRTTSTASASRQYAAVLANLTAAALGIHDYEGHGVGLEASQVLDGVRGVPAGTTLAAWVASTESALLAMAGGSSHDRSARESCRLIRRQAREINQGPRSGACPGQPSAMLQEADDDDMGGFGAGPAAAFADAGTGVGGPLSSGSRLRWTLDRAGQVELSIVDVTGRHVRDLVSGMFAAGTHDFAWDGRDDDGRSLRAGAYFVTGTIAGERTSRRFFILR